MQNGQTEQKQGFSLVLPARRRTKVRRVARFVRSIKHKINNNFVLFKCFKGFLQFYNLPKPLGLYCFMRSALFLHTLLLFLFCGAFNASYELAESVAISEIFCIKNNAEFFVDFIAEANEVKG